MTTKNFFEEYVAPEFEVISAAVEAGFQISDIERALFFEIEEEF